MERSESIYSDILHKINIKTLISNEQNKFLKDHTFSYKFGKKNYEFLIKVPCQRRLSCYQDYLNKISQEIVKFLNINMSDAFQINFDLVISTLLQDFSTILDKEVMYCLDREIELYRKKNNINNDKITPKESLEHLERFFSQFDVKKLKKRYPELFDLYDRITNNFITSIQLAFQRIWCDFTSSIKPGFLSAFSPDNLIELNSISLAGDLHKQGQQVLILCFVGIIQKESSSKNVKTDQKAKVYCVYKPSPVYLDALVVGNTKLLKKICSDQFKHEFSLVELLNEKIKNNYTDTQQFLPTYLIIPRAAEQSLGIHKKKYAFAEEKIYDFGAGYGYMSFIPVTPFSRPQGNWLFELACRRIQLPGLELMEGGEAKEQKQENYEQKYFDLYFTNMLDKAAFANNCNYITRDSKEIKLNSFINGIYAGLLTIFGGADFHADNMIRGHLIDLECFFTQQYPSLQEMVCLNSEVGAMHGDSLIAEEYQCLYDISGVKSKEIKILAKNHLFFYHEKEQMLQACQPDVDIFFAGYKTAIRTLTKTCHNEIQQWFSWIEKVNPYVRVVPYPTGTFHADIKRLRKDNFSASTIGPNGIGKSMHSKSLEQYKMQTDDSIFTVEPLPKVSVYCEENIADTINQLRQLNIPIYYARVNGRELFSASGKEIILFEEFCFKRMKKTDFFREPPLIFIKSRYNWLLTLGNRKILYTQTKAEIEKLLSDKERSIVPNFLMRLPRLCFAKNYAFPQLRSELKEEQKLLSFKQPESDQEKSSPNRKESEEELSSDSSASYTFSE